MTIEEMKRAKAALGYSYEKIADLSQMTPEGVRRIFLGKVKKPRLSSMDALEAVLRPYTVEEYWERSQERRCELFDGILYDVSLPTAVQQMLIGEVYSQIKEQIKGRNGKEIPMFVPVSVNLHADLFTMAEPDFIIVCDRDKIKEWGVLGAPDFVLEVLAVSARRKEAGRRLDHFARAGVREYWVLDPHQKEMTVYQPKQDAAPKIYPLTGALGLHIFDGAVIVNLDALTEILDGYQAPECGEAAEPAKTGKTERTGARKIEE